MEEFLRPYTEEEFDTLFKESGYPEIARQYCKEILAEWMDALIDGEVENLANPQEVLEAWRECPHEKPTVREEAWTKVGPYVQVYLSEREYGQSHEWARKYTQELLDEDSKLPYDDTFNEIRQTNPPAAIEGLLKLFRHVAQDKGEEYLYFLVLAHYDGRGGDTTIENIIRGVEKFFPIYQQQLADGHSESYAEAYGEAIIYKGWGEEESSNYAAIIEQAMANGSDYEQAAEIAQLLTDEHLCLKETDFIKEF